MESQPIEIIQLIFSFLNDPSDWVACKRVSKYWCRIFKDSQFSVELEMMINSTKGFELVCKNGYKELAVYIYKSGNRSLVGGICNAAEGGHKELVDLFTENLESHGVYALRWLNSGMAYSARGGHKNLIDLFIYKASKIQVLESIQLDWNLGMTFAAYGGHKDIVEFFIGKCLESGFFVNWNISMTGAVIGGYKDLVDLFIEKGANDWNLGLTCAVKGGHHDLVDFFIGKGSNQWYRGLVRAILERRQDMVDLFEKKISDSSHEKHNSVFMDPSFIPDWLDTGLEDAAFMGEKDLVDIFIGRGSKSWQTGMNAAAQGGHQELVDFFIEKGEQCNCITWKWWESGMVSAAQGGHRKLVDMFIKKGAKDWKRALSGAYTNGYLDMVEFLQKKTDCESESK